MDKISVELYKSNVPKEDIKEIMRFDKEGITEFISDPFTFDVGIVKNESGKVIGVGITRVINEFKMALDDELPALQKANTLKLLMGNAIELAVCNEVLITLTLPEKLRELERYKRIMEKHFGFYKDNGIVMRLEK